MQSRDRSPDIRPIGGEQQGVATGGQGSRGTSADSAYSDASSVCPIGVVQQGVATVAPDSRATSAARSDFSSRDASPEAKGGDGIQQPLMKAAVAGGDVVGVARSLYSPPAQPTPSNVGEGGPLLQNAQPTGRYTNMVTEKKKEEKDNCPCIVM